jgi:hypothetical protein
MVGRAGHSSDNTGESTIQMYSWKDEMELGSFHGAVLLDLTIFGILSLGMATLL